MTDDSSSVISLLYSLPKRSWWTLIPCRSSPFRTDKLSSGLTDWYEKKPLKGCPVMTSPLGYKSWICVKRGLVHRNICMTPSFYRHITASIVSLLSHLNGLCHLTVRQVSYSYTEAVSIDEFDSGLCLHIKAATFSGQYPLMKGLVDILERLGMRDQSPILKYNQVRLDFNLTVALSRYSKWKNLLSTVVWINCWTTF